MEKNIEERIENLEYLVLLKMGEVPKPVYQMNDWFLECLFVVGVVSFIYMMYLKKEF